MRICLIKLRSNRSSRSTATLRSIPSFVVPRDSGEEQRWPERFEPLKCSRLAGVEVVMRAGRQISVWPILVVLTAVHAAVAAETLDSLIAGAKKGPEFTFIA